MESWSRRFISWRRPFTRFVPYRGRQVSHDTSATDVLESVVAMLAKIGGFLAEFDGSHALKPSAGSPNSRIVILASCKHELREKRCISLTIFRATPTLRVIWYWNS
jgi:hypothetical protein